MKHIKNMTQAEVAAYVQSHLQEKGITVILSGGATVSVYTLNKYVSADVDLVNVNFADRKKIKAAMEEIGFHEEDRHFTHPHSNHIVEFPPGPLAVGDEMVKDINKIKLATGILRLISPTDCVKDRLSWYYHLNDRQCLYQAIQVAQKHDIDLNEIQRWSEGEGKLNEFKKIKKELTRKRA